MKPESCQQQLNSRVLPDSGTAISLTGNTVQLYQFNEFVPSRSPRGELHAPLVLLLVPELLLAREAREIGRPESLRRVESCHLFDIFGARLF